MNNKRATLEVIAPSIEEAVQKGLADLGLPREMVDITVLDEGSAGILGLGSRQARIRISVKSSREDPEPSAPETPENGAKEDHVLSLAEEIVSDLLQKMNIQAEVNAVREEKSDDLPFHPIKVNITGDDLSILIGKRAKTLNELQYITRLIMGKELERGVPLTIDVEGYRDRREQQVRQLAQRVARQVADTKRRQALEPMPANERRFAHIELRDNPQVYTESTGEEPNRKVVIYPNR